MCLLNKYNTLRNGEQGETGLKKQKAKWQSSQSFGATLGGVEKYSEAYV